MTEDEKRRAIAKHIDDVFEAAARYPGAWKPDTKPVDLWGYRWRETPLPELTGAALDAAYLELPLGSRPPKTD